MISGIGTDNKILIYIWLRISFQICIVQTSLWKISGHIAEIWRSSELSVLLGGKISRDQSEFCYLRGYL